MNRSIVHLDADAFFASVEQASDLRLRGKPVAVGGEKRGIIASASYEARKFGVRTPMPTAHARRLCPQLIVLPGDFEKYEQFSRWMFSYVYDFTPEVEICSIDEGYFDLTGCRKPAVEVAGTIRQAIGQSLKISVSEGVGANKLVSQIASKMNKPAAFLCVPPGREKLFLAPLVNQWLPGIGPKTAVRLNSAGLGRIGQIAATPVDLLELMLGNAAPQISRFSRGIDDRPLVAASEPAKSYSRQETFSEDQTREDFLIAVLQRMAEELMTKVRQEGKSIRTVTLKVRYNDLEEDQCSESLDEPTDLESDLHSRIPCWLKKAWKRRVSLRMVSLRLSNLYEGSSRLLLPLDQESLQRQARRRLADVVDELRRERGPAVVLRGYDFVFQKKLPSAPQRQTTPAVLSKRAGHRASGPSMAGALQFQSYYSFLSSTLSPADVVRLAVENGIPSVALTDDGNLHGAVAFVQEAQKAGIKPILGARLRTEKGPLWLYVESAAGYSNLCRILTRHDSRRDFESPAPVPPAVLEEGSGGLVAVGADDRLAEFFPGRFYHAAVDPREAAGSAFPVLPVFPTHYAIPSDRWKFDIVQSIRTRTLLRQAHPLKEKGGERHFHSSKEAAEKWRDHPRLLQHAEELAQRCSFDFPFGKPQFPAFQAPGGQSSRDYLKGLVLSGLQRRYPGQELAMQPKVNQELEIISAVGYEEYFLVMWEILQRCREKGIEWITRGSAADSMVCYCLGISDVCPVRFDLYFRRFLNRERMELNKLPDIDVDFPHDRKDEVIELIFQRYGSEQCAVVGGFSTYQARSAVGDVAKVLGISERQIRRFTERMPHAGADVIEQVLQGGAEFKDLPLQEEPYRTALKMAAFLDEFPRGPKMHPCGVVLSRRPMRELSPTFVSHKGFPTTHLDMDAVEALGLVKLDILAQGGLSVMRDTRRLLARRGIVIDLKTLRARGVHRELQTEQAGMEMALSEQTAASWGKQARLPSDPESPAEPWTDPAVWEMISSGGARAVHHIESPAMIGLCRMCQVRDIDGLIAIVSVIRPGAANENKKATFARRYQGVEPAEYPHPSLENCLRSTMGVVVYEEHILQICEAFAGLSPGRADVLRRALGKGRQETIDEIRKEFWSAALARGHSEQLIETVWRLVEGFTGYAFCKAHSTAYGVEAYQSAWLKCYFPAEFMASVLTNGKGFYHPLVYVLECHRMGISLQLPWINAPGPGYEVERGAIRVPIRAIKGMTERTLNRILEEHRKNPFSALADFYRRVLPLCEEMESLIRAGAFDLFGKTRTAQFWECQTFYRTFGNSMHPAQGWLLPPAGLDRLPQVPLNEPSLRQRLEWEMELFEFTISDHPLALFNEVAWDTYCPVSRLGNHVGEQVVTCGLVIEQRVHHQVTGEPMKFLTLADWTGIVETELFASTYRNYGLATVRYPVLEVTATVEPFENGKGFTLRVHRAGKPRFRKNSEAGKHQEE